MVIAPMATARDRALTRRERQIMDILYRRGRATAAEVMSDLSGEPNYSTVRTQLRVLEDKGAYDTRKKGFATSTVPPCRAGRRASRRCGISSTRSLMDPRSRSWAHCLAEKASRLSDEELARIAEMVAKAKKESKR